MWFLLLIAACTSEEKVEAVDLLAAVDPFIGTGGTGFSQGSASPAASAPAGMVKVGPDTTGELGRLGFSHCSGYWYEDPVAVAFSHTRLHGTGISEGGAIGFSPTTEPTVDWNRYQNTMDKSSEQASPGRYSVRLPGVATVDLAASPRAAHHRYAWEGNERWLTLDLGHTAADHSVSESWLTLGEQEITGFVRMQGAFSSGYGGQPTWFAARFSEPWQEVGLWSEGELIEGAQMLVGERIAATLSFATDVEVQVGISAVDLQGAWQNLEAELPDWDFEGLVERTETAWREELSTFSVTGGTEEEQAIFATALYHALLMPTLFTDVDGRYRGLDQQVHRARDWTYYTDFSLWDTYRTLHPLLILAYPDLAADHAASLVDMGVRGGELPVWPQGIGETHVMVGYASAIVLAETALKGVHGFDERAGFALAHTQARLPGASGSRADLSTWLEYGYLPSDLSGGSVAKTLEYAIDDAALALWAESLGYEEIAADYRAGAQGYTHIFDPESGFMRPRRSDGEFEELVEVEWSDSYVEGNAWQYTFLVPHDPDGLATLFGGADELVEKLDEFFFQSLAWTPDYLPADYYWHGNEPDIHTPFLYAAIGHPDKTGEWANWVREEHYSDTPSGLAGNDDGGTLSSWVIFASMGLYPLNATVDYVLTPPVFDEVILQRPQGPLRITAQGSGTQIEGVWTDGELWEAPRIDHHTLAQTSHLHFERREN